MKKFTRQQFEDFINWFTSDGFNEDKYQEWSEGERLNGVEFTVSHLISFGTWITGSCFETDIEEWEEEFVLFV